MKPISRKQMTGFLAQWAIRQSPYPVPDRLPEAVMQFREAWPLEPLTAPMEEWSEVEGYDTLYKAVWATIEKCPIIQSWNERKNGNKSPYGFRSAFSQPHPDDDFIDLHALARNMADSAWHDD